MKNSEEFLINKIGEILEKKEISMNSIAVSTGMSYTTIFNISKRKYLDTISLGTIIKICKVIDCELKEVYEIKDI